MSRTVKILLGMTVVGIVIYYILNRPSVNTAIKGSGGMGVMPCVTVNRTQFDIPWKDDAIPHGDLGSIAEQLLTGDAHTNGSLVGGFFKAIDVYPNKGRAVFFRDKMERYVQEIGLPYWEVLQGQLACDFEKTISNVS